jgi:hypothetical protein
MNAVTEDDMRAVAAELVSLAREGDVAAIKILFDRTLGRPSNPRVLTEPGRAGRSTPLSCAHLGSCLPA